MGTGRVTVEGLIREVGAVGMSVARVFSHTRDSQDGFGNIGLKGQVERVLDQRIGKTAFSIRCGDDSQDESMTRALALFLCLGLCYTVSVSLSVSPCQSGGPVV